MPESVLTFDERWESLMLANNFIFCKVMESNPDRQQGESRNKTE